MNMFTDYATRDDVKKELENRIRHSENVLAAWKNVKRETKKNGGDFANVNKNFSGCDLFWDFSSYKLRARIPYTREYGSEDIIYLQDAERTTPTPDGIAAAIANYITKQEENLTNERAALAEFDAIADRIEPAILELRGVICDEKKKNGGALEYLLRDYILTAIFDYFLKRR